MRSNKKGIVVFQDKMVLCMLAILWTSWTVCGVWVLYLTTLPTDSPLAAVWFVRVLFGIGILFIPFLLIVNPDRYIVWYRLTRECIEYHTAFRRKRELPYSCFPYVMHGKYLHGVYWRDYIVFSDRRLKDAELNQINHVSPSAEHFIKIRYSEKTAEKLMSVLPAKYQRTVSGIKESILKRKSA